MSTSKQTKMIHRLVDIKQRAVDKAETAHVEAHQRTLEAEAKVKRAISAWNDFVSGGGAAQGVASIADLEDRDREYKWLRKSIDDCERDVMLARIDETQTRETMTSARIELRRYETWLENTLEVRALEAKRVQMLADDEVAARNRRTS